MALHGRSTPVSTLSLRLIPRPGSGFAVFASAFASLVLVLIICEQLGLQRQWIGLLIVIVPALSYLAIGLASRASNADDFFIAGQGAPAFYGGLALAGGAIGATGLVGATGALFYLGFDGLVLVLGWCAGLALAGLLFAPYLRKAGAYSLPGYLDLRLRSRALRVVAAVALFPPCLMLLAAELKLGAGVAAPFLGLPPATVAIAGAVLALAAVIGGGMRSLTWTQSAQVIVVLMGVLGPLIVISIALTNLPLPQLTYGGLLKELLPIEGTHGITPGLPRPLGQALPGQQLEPLAKPFLAPFGAISPGDFVMLALSLMLGLAAAPGQAARFSAAPSAAAVRRSVNWAVLLAGVMALTLPAYAAFARSVVVKDLLGAAAAETPNWARVLEHYNFIRISGDQMDAAFGGPTIAFGRDSILLLLPVVTGLPFVLWGVAGAAAIAAALAAASAQIMAAGAAFGNDLYDPLARAGAVPPGRLLASRLGMVLAAGGALWLTWSQPFDPLRLMIWALSLSAGSFFAVLTLSIWWKRLTAWGALAGVLAGFFTTAGYILGGEEAMAAVLGVTTLTAAVVGTPASFIAAIAVSLVTPRCDACIDELVDEMRLPGGETLHARLTRLAARGKAPQP